MKWRDVVVNGRAFSMAHLQPFDLVFDIAGANVTVQVDFGFHCFTDDTGSGKLIFHKGERRYFSESRHYYSSQLPEFFRKRFFQSAVIPYYTGSNRRYYHLDLYDYAIFFEIRKPKDTENLLRVHVVSAYERKEWGKSGVPNGKPYNMRYILEVRNSGKIF